MRHGQLLCGKNLSIYHQRIIVDAAGQHCRIQIHHAGGVERNGFECFACGIGKQQLPAGCTLMFSLRQVHVFESPIMLELIRFGLQLVDEVYGAYP